MTATILQFRTNLAKRVKEALATGSTSLKAPRRRRTATQEAVLRLLRADRAISVHETFCLLGGILARRAGKSIPVSGHVSLSTVRRTLKAAQAEGRVHVEGRGVRHYPRRYRLPTPAFTFADILAGVGGMRLALERVGGECLYSSEINERARRTYQANFGDWPSRDIRGVQPADVPHVDVFAAGFSCQSFSPMGKRRGFRDPRGALFFNLVELIRSSRPRAVLLENSKGLAYRYARSELQTVIRLLTELGYRVHTKVLNAINFGLPQHRERVLIVGLLEDAPFDWPPANNSRAKLGEFLDPSADEDPRLQVRNEVLLEVRSRALHQRRDLFEPSVWSTNLSGAVSVLPHANALRATGSANYLLVNGKRRPSIGELAAWQGFPRSFHWGGSYTAARHQLGNAVPVPMIEAVGTQILGALHAAKLAREAARR